MKYRKKPVVVEAVQWTGSPESLAEIRMMAGDQMIRQRRDGRGKGLLIPTLEGDIIADAGDWIIKGIAGEVYPCRDAIFWAMYEQVEPDDDEWRIDYNR